MRLGVETVSASRHRLYRIDRDVELFAPNDQSTKRLLASLFDIKYYSIKLVLALHLVVDQWKLRSALGAGSLRICRRVVHCAGSPLPTRFLYVSFQTVL